MIIKHFNKAEWRTVYSINSEQILALYAKNHYTGVDFTATSGSNSVNSKDTSDLVIKISFDKASGAFKCCKKADDAAGSTFYKEISFKGRGTTSYGVKLVKDTGKHMQG